MKIGLCQLNVKAGRPEKNLQKMLELIEQAKSTQIDMIIFPEMAVGGYLVGDVWLEESWCDYLMECNSILQEASEGIILIYGNIFIDKSKRNTDGRFRKYNAAYIFQNKQPINHPVNSTLGIPNGVSFKSLLPNYRYFDDKRYFYPFIDLVQEMGVSIEKAYQPFKLSVDGKYYNIGLSICEDMWYEDYSRIYNKNRQIPYNPLGTLVRNGADFIVNISSSPWTFGKEQARDNRIQSLQKDLNSQFVPVYYVNACGVQNNGKNIITFDGGSTIYNQFGSQIFEYRAEDFQEQLITVDHSITLKDRGIHYHRRKPKLTQKYEAIIQGIRSFDEMMDWKPNYIIGLSGGVDSSLVATLVAHAVGSDRIIASNLPTEYNSAKTRSSAAKLVENLKINRYYELPISELVQENTKLLEKTGAIPSLAAENIQAKIRGTSILSNLAGMHNGVMTNNGNKLEIALGYATLYGDVNGAIAPIGDLTKTEVFQMARDINQQFGELIPPEVIPDENFTFTKDGIPPTAELKHNQLDPMKFGYHDALLVAFTDYQKKTPEDILRWYQKGEPFFCEKLGITPTLFEKYQLGDVKAFIADLEWFTKTIRKNIFKRIQSPPIVLVSKSAYGFDIRESQFVWTPSFAFQRLKKQILDNFGINGNITHV